MLIRILLIIFGLSSIHCEKYANYKSNNLIPIVVNGNYSDTYSFNINNTESYLFLYDYIPVKYILLYYVIKLNLFVVLKLIFFLL